MDTTETDPIVIETLSDAHSALKRNKGSFEEWLQCASIFSKHKQWANLEIAAGRALDSVGQRPISQLSIREAAKRYTSGALAEVRTLNGLVENCRIAQSKLNAVRSRYVKAPENLRKQIEISIQTLDEILLLLADGSAPALVSVASKLRKKLGRPDLCIRTATYALKLEPQSASALTTRGSAYCEIEAYKEALEDLLMAEKDQKSRPYALAAHSKLLISKGNYAAAYVTGQELLQRKLTRPILYLLAAAAKGAQLDQEFSRLVKLADKLPESKNTSGQILLTRKALEVLIETKQFTNARQLFEQLKLIDKSNKVKVYEKLLYPTLIQ